jgi:hypothetical protein
MTTQFDDLGLPGRLRNLSSTDEVDVHIVCAEAATLIEDLIYDLYRISIVPSNTAATAYAMRRIAENALRRVQ